MKALTNLVYGDRYVAGYLVCLVVLIVAYRIPKYYDLKIIRILSSGMTAQSYPFIFFESKSYLHEC